MKEGVYVEFSDDPSIGTNFSYDYIYNELTSRFDTISLVVLNNENSDFTKNFGENNRTGIMIHSTMGDSLRIFTTEQNVDIKLQNQDDSAFGKEITLTEENAIVFRVNIDSGVSVGMPLILELQEYDSQTSWRNLCWIKIDVYSPVIMDNVVVVFPYNEAGDVEKVREYVVPGWGIAESIYTERAYTYREAFEHFTPPERHVEVMMNDILLQAGMKVSTINTQEAQNQKFYGMNFDREVVNNLLDVFHGNRDRNSSPFGDVDFFGLEVQSLIDRFKGGRYDTQTKLVAFFEGFTFNFKLKSFSRNGPDVTLEIYDWGGFFSGGFYRENYFYIMDYNEDDVSWGGINTLRNINHDASAGVTTITFLHRNLSISNPENHFIRLGNPRTIGLAWASFGFSFLSNELYIDPFVMSKELSSESLFWVSTWLRTIRVATHELLHLFGIRRTVTEPPRDVALLTDVDGVLSMDSDSMPRDTQSSLNLDLGMFLYSDIMHYTAVITTESNKNYDTAIMEEFLRKYTGAVTRMSNRGLSHTNFANDPGVQNLLRRINSLP